jgi:hypothetical protein
MHDRSSRSASAHVGHMGVGGHGRERRISGSASQPVARHLICCLLGTHASCSSATSCPSASQPQPPGPRRPEAPARHSTPPLPRRPSRTAVGGRSGCCSSRAPSGAGSKPSPAQLRMSRIKQPVEEIAPAGVLVADFRSCDSWAILCSKRSLYQDRLGTNTGKSTQKEMMRFSQVGSS